MASESTLHPLLKSKLRNREDLKEIVDFLNQERILTHSENEEIAAIDQHCRKQVLERLISVLQRKGQRSHAKILQQLQNQDQSTCSSTCNVEADLGLKRPGLPELHEMATTGIPPSKKTRLSVNASSMPSLPNLKATLDNHMPSVLEKINLQALIPYLISHGLLTEHERQLLRNNYLTEHQRKQELIAIIQSKGSEGCRMFLAAVSEEQEHLGHREIVAILTDPGSAAVAPITGRDAALSATATATTTPGDHQQSRPVTAAEAVVEPSKVSIQLLEGDIEREIQELEDQFLKVVREAAKNLRTVELLDVKLCLTQLRVSVRYRHIRFLERNRSAIASATSVDDILAILGLYWSYFNCGLLAEVVRKLGSDQTKQLMQRYMEELKKFRLKTKLGDFVGKSTPQAIPNFVELVTKMGEDWRDRTLEDLEEFRQELAKSMQLEDYAVHFTSAEAGCIAVTWALHGSLPEIADVIQAAFQLLVKRYCVLKVILQGKCISEQKSLESPLSATPPAPLPLPTPPERSEVETSTFDVIAALLNAGVPNIVEQILQSLDVKSLVMSEQVSSTWRRVIKDLHIWKRMIKNNVNCDPLWRALFKRRGWNKYLDMPPAEQVSRQFYRQLYDSASRDIRSLEANWRRGHYTLTRVETGSMALCLQCDDDKIVTGQGDSTIKIWDRSTLQVLNVLEGHTDSVWRLQYKEEVAISGAQDHTIKVWNIQTGQVINELLHHKDRVNSLKFTADTLVTASGDGTVAVWKIKSPTDIILRMTLIGHESWVLAVDLNETKIISGAADKTIKVWDNFSGDLVQTLHGHTGWVRCLQLKGSHIISGSSDKTLRVWSIDTGECIRVLQGHDRFVLCVVVDNKRILSGSCKTLKVWDLAAALDAGSSSDTLCITTLKEHTGYVWGVQIDDFQAISVSDDGTLLTHDFLDPTLPILRT